jgi:3-deoxy-manno-octulosonate cytidylyltransferase (CMP-KDO synthetase)
MKVGKKILCCIPARYASTRLPGKPLLKLGDKTIIEHVYSQAKKTMVDEIIVLTDNQEIYNEVTEFGGKCFITMEDVLNGTERIVNYLKSVDHSKFDIIVNLQGDEPFISPEVVNKVIENYIINKPTCSTVCYKTNDVNEITSRSRGKVVTNKENDIMYCSRNVIPSCKDSVVIPNHTYNIHVGIFVFNKNYLLNEYNLENTKNQLFEDIEWLKIIEQGKVVNTIFTEKLERGVDTTEDYEYLKEKYNM